MQIAFSNPFPGGDLRLGFVFGRSDGAQPVDAGGEALPGHPQCRRGNELIPQQNRIPLGGEIDRISLPVIHSNQSPGAPTSSEIMKKKHPRHLNPQGLILAAVAGWLFSTADARTWTSADGSKTFEGELQTYDAGSGKVTVTLSSGKRMTFSQDKLSEEDIAWLKKNGNRSGGALSRSGSCPRSCPIPTARKPI